jgi:hypothetical protein
MSDYTFTTMKARFEMPKDIRAFYATIAKPEWGKRVTLLTIDPSDFALDGPEVTFEFWCGPDDNWFTDVKNFANDVYDTGRTLTWEDGEPAGIETHVFVGSLKLAKDYDGRRNGPWVPAPPSA